MLKNKVPLTGSTIRCKSTNCVSSVRFLPSLRLAACVLDAVPQALEGKGVFEDELIAVCTARVKASCCAKKDLNAACLGDKAPERPSYRAQNSEEGKPATRGNSAPVLGAMANK